MKIATEPIKAGDLQPGDLFTTEDRPEADWQKLADSGGAIVMHMRTEGDSGLPADMNVFRLKIERRRWTHGLRSTYIAGCRCTQCTTAQRLYMRNYKRGRRAEEAAEVAASA